MSNIKRAGNLFGGDLEALLNYCQDDRERKDFRNHLIENERELLTEGELETLELSEDSDKVQVILERVAEEAPEVNHIWAVAHRVRTFMVTLQDRAF